MSPDEVRTALPDRGIGQIAAIERIKHGLTNDSWLVIAESSSFVIRRSNASEESLQIDRRSEAVILDAVASAGIGPEVIRNDVAGHILVTRYAGPTWNAAQALEPHNIDRVAALLRRLHAMTPPHGVRHVDLLSVSRGYVQTLEEWGATCAPMAPALRKRAAEIAGTLQRLPDCLCHNDVHALNIVDAGELRLVDWEYAGLGERYFDLASICVYHGYSRSQREQLLNGYDVCSVQAWHRLEVCCWLFDYIRDLWTAVRELSVAH